MVAIICEETCAPQKRGRGRQGPLELEPPLPWRPKLRHIVCLPTFIIIIGQGRLSACKPLHKKLSASYVPKESLALRRGLPSAISPCGWS